MRTKLTITIIELLAICLQADATTTYDQLAEPGTLQCQTEYAAVDINLQADHQATPHEQVRETLKNLRPGPTDIFADIGCGADARWCVAAVTGYGCKAIGIERDPQIAEQARLAVRLLGLQDEIRIIQADAAECPGLSEANVAVAYLWPEELQRLKPVLMQFDRFATLHHKLEGVPQTEHGPAWIYRSVDDAGDRWVTDNAGIDSQGRPFATYSGGRYYGRQCSNAGCAMCSKIEQQLQQVSAWSSQAKTQGHWETRQQRQCYTVKGKRYCRMVNVRVWVPD